MHGIGVLLNCTTLSRLLSLSSAMVVCLNAKTESRVVKEEKKLLLLAIDRTAPAVLAELCKKDEQSPCSEFNVEIQEPLSPKIREMSPFSNVLKRRVASMVAKMDDKPNQPHNLFYTPKVVEYLQTYIFPLALLRSGLLLGTFN